MESEVIEVHTGRREAVHNITRACAEFTGRVASGGDGLLHVFVPHATAGLALMELGAGSEADLLAALAEILPADDRWRHAHGLTNVWSRRPLHDTERLKGTLRRAAPRVYNPTAASSAHLNQKPLEFMERLIAAVTEPGDVIWEPFGGLCSASFAAVTLGRRAYAAETDPAFADLAAARVAQGTPWP